MQSHLSLLLAQAVPEAAKQVSIIELLGDASGVVLAVLALLIFSSIASWFVIGFKTFQQTRAFLAIFWDSKRLDAIYAEAERLPHSPVSQVFQAGFVELRKLRSQQEADINMGAQLGAIENVERALRRAAASEIAYLERLITALATIGSAAPFVGLFGTVWGIMLAFVNLSNQASGAQLGINVVAGPIAEALVATAIGLGAAIPAVVAYNFLNAKIQDLSVEMESFTNDFLNIVKRNFLK
jgi:biopolymer transport protein TolQ